MRLSRFRRAGGTAARLPETPRDPQHALDTADRLAAEDRALDAVRLLVGANREYHDAKLAARIVDLRHLAFRQQGVGVGTGAFDSDAPDLFESQLIPEVSHRDFTIESLRSAIRHHGMLLVRGFAERTDTRALASDIERAFSAFDDAQQRGAPGADGWFRPYSYDRVSDRAAKRAAGCVLAVDSPPAMFDVIETFERASVGQLVGDYFGETPALLARKWSLRKVERDATTGDWHQDGAFMGQDIRSLNVWLTLSDCGDVAPGIDVVARRIDGILETGTEGAFFPWSIGAPVAERAAEGHVVRPIFEACDALLFDHLCVHRTAVDREMTQDRYAIEAWFLAPSTYGAMLNGAQEGYAPRDQIPLIY